MDRDELIHMLNKVLPDEHASVIRYLTHAYQVGEDTPFGSMLLSTAREEMWHMNWLGDEIGELGAEPDMVQGVYPHDPTSNASLLRSYIEWEKNLVGMYADLADQTENPEIKRMLQQQGLESATHQRRFEEWLEKLGPEGEEPFEQEEGDEFSPEMLKHFEREVSDQYKLVLQHLRHAFVFEEEICPVGSELELTAMRHMKHLSHFAEELAESGQDLDFAYPGIDLSRSAKIALASDLELTEAARERFMKLNQDPELAEHASLRNELENMITRNEFLAETVKGLMPEVEEHSTEPEVQAQDEPKTQSDDDDSPKFTIGSLIGKE